MRNKIDILSVYSELTTLIDLKDIKFEDIKKERVNFLMNTIEKQKCNEKNISSLYSELITLSDLYPYYTKNHKGIIDNRMDKVTKQISKLTKKGIV